MRKCKFCGTESIIDTGTCPSCGGNCFLYFVPRPKQKKQRRKYAAVSFAAVILSSAFILAMSLMDIVSSADEPVYSAKRSTHYSYAPKQSIISQDFALLSAVNHAGIDINDAKKINVIFKEDDGIPCYKVTFRHGHDRYSCKVDASSGHIIKFKASDD